MKEELLKGLTEEQIARVKACKTTEEMLALAKEEGIELTEEQLEAVSGGNCGGTGTSTRVRSGKIVCPYCHGGECYGSWYLQGPVDRHFYYCPTCHREFDTPYKG